MFGKCPSCGDIVTMLKGSGIDVMFPDKNWKAVTYNCPSCNSILGCQIDPIAIMTDTVRNTKEAVLEALGRGVGAE